MKTVFCMCLLLAAAWSQDDANEVGKPETLLRIPPSLDEQPEQETIYRDSDAITLPCKATGEPQPTYEWKKNGKILDLNAVNIKSSADPADGTIIIDPATILDQGYYQCIASNQHGKSLSTVAFLQKAVLGSYPPAEPRIYAVTEGDSLTVQCEGLESVPQPTFSWALVDSTTDESPVPLQTSRRVQIDESGNLYFSHVTMDDAKGGKLYKCNVFNAHLDITTGGSYSEIQVTSNPNAGDIAPARMYVTPAPIIALAGEPFAIKCLFSGRSEPRVTWGRVGAVLPAGRNKRNHYDTELEVTGTMFEDEGKYTCQGIGSSQTSEVVEIVVDVQSKPTFIEKPEKVNATEGESQTFVCTANAEPAANILWLKNGDPLDPSNPGERMEISPDGHTLTISDLCKDCNGKSDLMVIQCNASNNHGYVFADGYLNVLLPTKIVERPETVRLEGDAVDIEEVIFKCRAESDDSTSVFYTWYFEDDEIYFENEEDITLQDGRNIVINLKGKTLEQKGKHDGTYKCVASNDYSQDSAMANLEVPGVVKPIVGAGIGELWWVFLIIAIILLLLILLLCCCLCIQRNKGDTYPVDEKERANGNDPEKELVDSGFHDYQRPEEGPIKGSRASLSSTIKLDSDDEGSLNEYGDIDAGKFTEDGSFIGQYATDKRRRANDSQV